MRIRVVFQKFVNTAGDIEWRFSGLLTAQAALQCVAEKCAKEADYGSGPAGAGAGQEQERGQERGLERKKQQKNKKGCNCSP